jgi:DegV family protein with EDD domain
MKLRIAMDSAGDIPAEWAEEYDVHIIPINIHFGERTFFQGVDLSNEGFYKLVDESGTIPKTSQPTPHQFIEFYKGFANPGDTVISIHVTSKLSGTFESAEIAAVKLKDEMEIIPVDSGGGSASLGYMCRETREMERRGFSLGRILDRLQYIKEHTEIILTLDTLDYARMSGRVKAMQAALASMLNVKPIVVLADGLLDVTEKVRTRRKSIDRIIERMKERVGDKKINIAVVHAQDPKIGNRLLELVKGSFNYRDLIFSELSTGIAANLGPGTVGIIAYPAMES